MWADIKSGDEITGYRLPVDARRFSFSHRSRMRYPVTVIPEVGRKHVGRFRLITALNILFTSHIPVPGQSSFVIQLRGLPSDSTRDNGSK